MITTTKIVCIYVIMQNLTLSYNLNRFIERNSFVSKPLSLDPPPINKSEG